MEAYLAELRDVDARVATSKLVILSDLSPEEVQVFKRGWPLIDVRKRRQIAEWLVELSEDNLELDFDMVFRAILDDPDGEVKVKAMEGLWGSEDDSLIDDLVDLLKRHSEPPVRAAAAGTLGGFALRAELGDMPVSEARRVERVLLDVFDDDEEALEVRRKALEGVSALSRPEVRDAIRKAYASPGLPLKASAIYAMGRNCDRNWLPALLKELRSPHAQLRFEAARACGELEAPEAVPRLSELISDPDEEVRLSAIEALGKIGGPESKEALEGLRDTSDEVLREAVEDALEDIRFWEDPSGL